MKFAAHHNYSALTSDTSTVIQLRGAIQHYAWGGYEFLPALLDIEPANEQPYAELWMGTHRRGPATVTWNGLVLPLNQLLQEHPELLGDYTVDKFGKELPFLFKVLDVKEMLSIQTHPTKEQAEKGFAEENKLGVSLTASDRNFKDANHKPEIMVALTPFWLLHGFRPAAQIRLILEQVSEFEVLKPHFRNEDIYTLYKYVMSISQEEVNSILDPLYKRLRELQLKKTQPDYWALKAFYTHQQDGNYDRGIFSVYFLNLVHIPVGKGIFQQAGVLHAYLEGVNVELMANSDNVFRGGLTVKHIDVKALLKHTSFDPVEPDILDGTPVSDKEIVFTTPADDFELSRIELSPGQTYLNSNTRVPQILILMDGKVVMNKDVMLSKGSIFFVPAQHKLNLESLEHSIMFKASVPIK